MVMPGHGPASTGSMWPVPGCVVSTFPRPRYALGGDHQGARYPSVQAEIDEFTQWGTLFPWLGDVRGDFHGEEPWPRPPAGFSGPLNNLIGPRGPSGVTEQGSMHSSPALQMWFVELHTDWHFPLRVRLPAAESPDEPRYGALADDALVRVLTIPRRYLAVNWETVTSTVDGLDAYEEHEWIFDRDDADGIPLGDIDDYICG